MPIPFVLIGIAAATGVAGIGSGAVGAKKMYDANQMIKDAQYRYDNKKEKLDFQELLTNSSLESLGELKLRVWRDFDRFAIAYEKIKNKPKINSYKSEDKFVLSKHELEEIQGVSITALNILGTSALSAGVGALAGIAAYGGTMTFGVASTGTAIASLSGAAATNATLAALGGGSLATGGLGMAGGTAVLGGMVAGPVLAVGGIFLAIKGNESKNKALEIKREVNDAIKTMNIGIAFLEELQEACINMEREIDKAYKVYIKKVNELENIIEKNSDYNYFSYEERVTLQNTILLVKLLSMLTRTDILSNEGKKQVVNTNEVNLVINEAKKTIGEI